MVIWPRDAARLMRQIWTGLRASFPHLFGGGADAANARRREH